MSFHFELGTPFRPYEQLMGVLPVASKDHIPIAYQVNFIFDLGLLLSETIFTRI